jgi:hypothetical protein
MPIVAARLWPSILSILLLIPHLAAADEVRVRATVANVRANGAAQAPVVFRVKAGETLKLVETAGDWIRIETADGRRGWIAKSLVEVLSSAPASASAPPPPQAPATSSGASAVAIEHQDVACMLGDRYPRLDACFQPKDALGNAKVLFRAGEGPWYAVDWIPEGACHVAYLPKPLESTTEIEYYVAAVDRAFNERQQPETAPETAYRARVVRNQGDCDRLKKIAASVRNVAKPIVVAAGRTGVGAPAVLGAMLVGFSSEGVVLATAAAAAGAAGAGGVAAAGTAAGTGTGGGIGTGTLAIAGGAVAVAGIVAVAAGGGEEEQPCLDAREIAALNQGATVAVSDDTLCGTDFDFCGRGLSFRACVGGLCSRSCSIYYEMSDGRRFTCGALPDCFAGSASQLQDPTFCLAAAQQVLDACQ